MRHRSRAWAWLVPVLLLVAAGARAGELTDAQRRGRRIYLEGESPSSAGISALAAGGVSLPASALPCAGCHGKDGLGGAEGSVQAPELVWSKLTKPYGHLHPNGRRHPALDRRALGRLIRQGIDPAGNVLDPAMPRYSLSSDDLADLLAYLEAMESDLGPGLTEARIRLGTVVPAGGRLGEAGRAMAAALQSAFERVNARGGIHGRTLELVVAEFDGDREAGLAAARRLVEEREVLALVGGLFPGAEGEVFALTEREQVPFVGPYTLHTPRDEEAGRQVFFLQPGIREQARALVRFLAMSGGGANAPVGIVHGEETELADAAQAARRQLEAEGWNRVETARCSDGDAAVERLQGRGAVAVLLLCAEVQVAGFLRQAEARSYRPRVLVPGVFGARAAASAPGSFAGRLFLAYPSIPSSAPQKIPLARAPPSPVTLGAEEAAAVVIEGLARSGRRLSRERFVRALEGLSRFAAGPGPAVSFGPNRRVGELGAFVVALDPRSGSFRPVGPWISLE